MSTTLTSTNLPVLPKRPKPQRTLEEGAVLARARRAQADVHAAEARKLEAAVAWAALHVVDDVDDAANWGETSLTLGGAGVPLIARGCVAEFAAVIGTSTNGGRAFLADALELAHRLPLLYARIQAGTLPAWKGRRIAAETTVMASEHAAELDALVAPVAAKLSAARTQRLVDETIARLMPAHAQELADSIWREHVAVNHRQVSFCRTSRISGALDMIDAQDLDARLERDAQALQDAGSSETLDVRRALALGMLARGEAIDGQDARPPRRVELVVHLPADVENPTALAEVADGRLLTQAQVAAWTGNPEVTVVVRPVIDLHTTLSTRSYEVPDKIRRHLELRDETCVFPWCDRPARHTQKDHITAFDDGGLTSTDNLASLCQHHHNLKTHGGWTYVMIEPGVYRWRSPNGYAFLRDRSGTRELTPRPVDPPGAAACRQ